MVMIVHYFYLFVAIVLIVYYSMTLVQFVVLLRKKKDSLALTHEPHVAVLIAARNEEENIIRCLEALVQQNYPKDKLQILVGDDASDDDTAALVSEFMQRYDNIELVSITPSTQTNLKGKTNVLATLFKKVTGEFAFITDADIAVNPNWIKGMLAGLEQQQADAASGTTFVEHHNSFQLFQTIEWMEALGFLYTADQLKIKVTAVGNNMVISKKSYDDVGGYEAIPFSVTEDLDLYLELKKKNYTHRMFLGAQALVWTKALDSFKALLKQRKRWMKGVERTPIICQMYLSIHASFLFFIVAIATYDIYLGIALYLVAVATHAIRVALMCRVTEVSFKPSWWGHLLILELYQFLFTVCLLVYYIWPTGIEWKKRRYV
ncbi:MAG: family 2 glycosyl transferase [Chitinophagaceae bacterium]|nr:family 2 glycosyl transferase [Chitinophagaceae bacterium]